MFLNHTVFLYSHASGMVPQIALVTVHIPENKTRINFILKKTIFFKYFTNFLLSLKWNQHRAYWSMNHVVNYD